MLLQNGTTNAQYPRRMVGGGNAVDRTMWGRAERRNVFFGAASYDARCGVPQGYLDPVSWILPQKTGGLSSVNEVAAAWTLTGAGARGVNGAAALTLAWSFAGTGQTVVSGTAAITWSETVAGNAVATLNAASAITAAWSFTAPIGARANLEGALTGTWSPVGAITATGALAADISTYTELSPENLANAVWAQVIEAGFTAEQVLRLIAAVTAGDATGLESGSPSFEGIDESTTRVAGTYSGGTRNITTRNGA